ncbi:MAG: hypothetical protein EOO65_02700 [Methanosarcinales archaeon]|nr:MAG: hypothetical protein EOO65_02700 [Methanosarcinales archaeon]
MFSSIVCAAVCACLSLVRHGGHDTPCFILCVALPCSGFFTVNLFVAAIVDEFERSREQLGESHLLTDTQKEWVRTQETLLLVRPKRRIKPPSHPRRRLVYNLVTSTAFEYFILFCISVNVIALMLPFLGMEQDLSDGLDSFNTAFAALFTVEAALKIYGIGWQMYWGSSAWNKFDLIVVIASDVGIIMSFVTTTTIGALGTVARVMRILRMVRLAHSLKSLRHMISTLVLAVPSLINIGALLVLLLFMYAIAGVHLFSHVKYGAELTPYNNFRNLGNAMLLLYVAFATTRVRARVLHVCACTPLDLCVCVCVCVCARHAGGDV